MKRSAAILLSILSGCLLGVSWPETGGFSWLIFIALVPLLYVEHLARGEQRKLKVIWYAYLTFFIFNLWTTWWVYYASDWGMIMAVVCNSMFMAVVFYLFHLAKRFLGYQRGMFALVFFWVGFEWLHLNWDLSWPWLTLGNVFSNDPYMIQWYEYTGTLGGSIWILAVNIFVFSLFIKILHKGTTIRDALPQITGVLILLLLPILFSLKLSSDFKATGPEANFVVIQPNIDPYNVKFDTPAEDQMEEMLNLAEEKTTLETDFIIAPETAIPNGMYEDQLHNDPSIAMLKAFQKRFPRSRLIFGASTYIMYHTKDRPNTTARLTYDRRAWYDAYNTSLQIDATDSIQLYHKSKLVLGVEKMPFSWLERLSINLGGTVGSLGTDSTAKVFSRLADNGSDIAIGTAICYESVYGEYFGEYVKNGAEIMAIITNDGWWENTPGYRQHLSYARLRAIETRRAIARSANTGISAFVSPTGEVSKATGWWVPAVIEGTLKANTTLTFYARFGDYLGRLCAALAVIMVIYMVAYRIRTKPNSEMTP